MHREKSFLPSYLNPDDPAGNKRHQKNVQTATGGDISKFKRDSVIIYQEPLEEVSEMLGTAKYGVQFVKMYSLSYRSRIYDMADFVGMCKKYDTIPYIGGGVTENALEDGSIGTYARTLQNTGINAIEVSNSKGTTRACQLRREIRALRKDFKTLLIEIGTKKYGKDQSSTEWEDDLKAALDMGADHVILEGGGGGNYGIYDRAGNPRHLLVTKLVHNLGEEMDKIVIEAPCIHQREYWTNELFGWKARLGNISPDELPGSALLRLKAMDPAAAKKLVTSRSMHNQLLAHVTEKCSKHALDEDVILFDNRLNNITAKMALNANDWRKDIKEMISKMLYSR